MLALQLETYPRMSKIEATPPHITLISNIIECPSGTPSKPQVLQHS